MYNCCNFHTCMYVCMIITYIRRSVDQPGKVANPARRQLNTENRHFPFPLRAGEFGLARRVRPSRPASACSFSTLRLNLVLLLTIFLPVSAAMSLCLNRHTISSQSRISRFTQLRTDGVHYRESAGTGPVVSKVVPVTGAALAGHHEPINVHLSIPTPTIGIEWAC